MPSKRPRRRAAERMLAWLSTAGLVIVSLLALFTVIFPLVLGAQSYTVLTGSMKPALEPGYLIGVRPTPIAEISVGDIVTFQLESGEPAAATHRVVSVGFDGSGEKLLITQGDANNVADTQPVREVQLRGVVVYAVPWFGYPNSWATPAIKSAVVATLGLAAISWGVIVLGRDLFQGRRPARHRLLGAVVLALALVPLSDAELASAAEPPSEPALQLSTDGTHWVTDGSLTLFQADKVFIPGDNVNAPLWIRNASPDVADLQLTATWNPTDPHSVADSSLAQQLEVSFSGAPVQQGRNWRGGELPPGGDRKIDVIATLPWPANNDARNGSASLLVTVILTESPLKPIDSALSSTGQTASTLPWLFGGAGIAVGLLLALGGISRRRHIEILERGSSSSG